MRWTPSTAKPLVLVNYFLRAADHFSSAFVGPLHSLPGFAGDPFSAGPYLVSHPLTTAVDATYSAGLAFLLNGHLRLGGEGVPG